MTDFKAGDQVILKSGGPIMTIDTIETEYSVTAVKCVWFDNKFEPHSLTLGPDSIRQV